MKRGDLLFRSSPSFFSSFSGRCRCEGTYPTIQNDATLPIKVRGAGTRTAAHHSNGTATTHFPRLYGLHRLHQLLEKPARHPFEEASVRIQWADGREIARRGPLHLRSLHLSHQHHHGEAEKVGKVFIEEEPAAGARGQVLPRLSSAWWP